MGGAVGDERGLAEVNGVVVELKLGEPTIAVVLGCDAAATCCCIVIVFSPDNELGVLEVVLEKLVLTVLWNEVVMVGMGKRMGGPLQVGESAPPPV